MKKLLCIWGLSLLAAEVSAEDLCVSRLSVIEDSGITTLDAKHLQGLGASKEAESDEKPEPSEPSPSFKVDYGDGPKGEESTLVESGDDGVKTGVVQYGDQESAENSLVDYGDQDKPNEGGPLVVRGDHAPIDLDDREPDGQPASAPSASPFEALLGASMGGNADLAKGLRLTPTRDGFGFAFENLFLKIQQTPPPKSFQEVLEGITRESGQAHVRMDTLPKGGKCVPATWNGSRLGLQTEAGNQLVLQFEAAKALKKVSKKSRRVFEFQGPMQLGIEGK